MAARGALLRYLRVNVNPSSSLANPTTITARETALPFTLLLRRFSEQVRGSFLDKSDVTDRVVTVFKRFGRVDPSKVTPKALLNDLELESINYAEVLMGLEVEFGFEIPDTEAAKFQSIDRVVDFIASHPQAK